jgi:heme exporter protein C
MSDRSVRDGVLAGAARGASPKVLAAATAAVLALALSLVFFYAPLDAEQGFLQKIFYVHVPLAIVSLCGFVAGGVLAILHLRSGDSRWDVRSYVAIHMSLIFGVATLITGSIWAKGSWGHWWVWDEPTLVSFLIVFLLYATYQPLRFAIEDPERQARYASVFAITAGAFVPMNFIAVRLASGYVHPRVLGTTGNLPGPMELTFVVSLLGIVLLYLTLCALELATKGARARLRALRRSEDAFSGVVDHRMGRSAAPSFAPPVRAAGTLPSVTSMTSRRPDGRRGGREL